VRKSGFPILSHSRTLLRPWGLPVNTAPVSSSAGRSVRVREIREGESLRDFIDVAWRINAGDPNWVPPLRMALETALNRSKHPFHRHAEVAYLVAEREGRVVGRVAAILNRLHNEYHGERTGFFGLFECENDTGTARALLDTAAGWLRERGMERMRGPVNFSTNEEIASPGVLIEGFDTPPVVMMSHNPPYYRDLLEAAGLEKAKDLYAFWLEGDTPPERFARSYDRILARSGVTIRSIDPKHFRRDIDILKEIYNSAWSKNWGFVPMTDAEFEHMAKEFRPVADLDLCLIAEIGDEPVGLFISLPDLNQALRHLPSGRLFPFGLFRFLWYRRRIHGMRVITLGIKPGYRHLGLDSALYLRGWQAGREKGYDQGEASWILEDNLDMVRPMERIGGKIYKSYRTFERAL
jgi:GNAT superfamily N-acetyltransferase